MGDVLNESINLSKNLETEGFDLQAGQTWIYPTNYPVREYQHNIIQKALLKNTLVSLPTGLGKTFIAAVVMFNYFRWYPLGKVIFMAPTRPLVKQQIDACYDIMAIPKEASVEITGVGTKVTSREEIWNDKRVFFITPQILQNDLDKFPTLGTKIKCLVFDEAHRARGNHSYCEVIRKLSATNKYFRVLALSATPGGTIEDVLDVVQNLLISHLEFRTEESLDVSPYVFKRNLTTVVVPLGDKLQQVKDDYMKVLEYYTRTLVKYKIIQGNCANLTKGKIFMLTKSYQQNRGTGSNYNEIMRCLNICITLYHASELLIRHGLRSFLTFFDEHIDKPLIKGNTMVREIMTDVREYLGPPPQVLNLPTGDVTEISPSVKFGHPKFYKLRDILIDHFRESNNSSRVIVFFEYRESVNEAYALLIQSKPAISPRIFVGQKQGVTQKIQINVIKQFREGTCNVLLSTCIGEEGLDVGEVDLIICFDISNKSPIRMVQRMGRTGRKKDGKIIVLVTEGKEQQTLKDCLIHKNNVANHVLGSKHLVNSLHGDCPRLIPDGLVPKCEKIFITVQKPVVKKGGTLKDMLRTLSSKSSEPSFSPNLEITDFQEKIPQPQLLSNSSNALNDESSVSTIFSKRIEKQRSFQETHKVGHSENCELLVNLLQIAESRRFNIPMTQISNSSNNNNNKQLKQTDIRKMFFKSQSAKDFDIPPTQIPTIPDVPIITEEKLFPALFTEIATFLSISFDTNPKKCNFCPTEFECGTHPFKNYFTTTLSWVELESSVYTSVTLDDLKMFEKKLDGFDDSSFQFEETLDFSVPDIPDKINEEILLELDLLESSILGDFCDKSVKYEAPKTLNNLLNKYSTSIIDEQLVDCTSNKNFSEADIKSFLIFFKLDNLNDIFEDSISIRDSQETITYSPDLFEESIKDQVKTPVRKERDSDDSCSPILCTFTAKRNKPTQNVKKSLQEIASPSLTTFSRKEFTSTPLTQKLKNETIPTSRDKSGPNPIKKGCEELLQTNKTDVIELEDLFDFSSFGLPPSNKEKSDSSQNSKIIIEKSNENLDISQFDDFISENLLKTFKLTRDDNITEMKTSNTTISIETQKSLDLIDGTMELEVENAEKKDKQLNRNEKVSQATVTQILSTINKPSQSNKSSQKENVFEDDDFDFLQFSFNKTIPKHLPSVNTPKNPKRKLNDSTLNSVNSSEESVSLCTFPKRSVHKKSNISHNSSASTLQRSKLNKSNNSFSTNSLSEDEFDTKPKSPVWIRPKQILKKRKLPENDSDDDFEISPMSNKPPARKKSILHREETVSVATKSKRRKLINQFIEDEADVSACGSIEISDDELNTETQDKYDESFVADETQNMNTQMHAVYLKSVRSPLMPGRFKIPFNVKTNVNVFSQQENIEDDTYLDDSFVVHDETIETDQQLSQLEILEKKLEMQRKNKKALAGLKKASKKKRILYIDSDSD